MAIENFGMQICIVFLLMLSLSLSEASLMDYYDYIIDGSGSAGAAQNLLNLNENGSEESLQIWKNLLSKYEYESNSEESVEFWWSPKKILEKIGIVTSSDIDENLSLPQNDENKIERKKRISMMSSQIKNEKRVHFVNGIAYDVYPGPIPHPFSLAQKMIASEAIAFVLASNPNLLEIGATVNEMTIDSISDYFKMYKKLFDKKLAPIPYTVIDDNDINFANVRLTLGGNTLRIVNKNDEILSDDRILHENVMELCDDSLLKLLKNNKLFVEDLSFASLYNNKNESEKFVPSIKGYFCVRPNGLFMPLAIHILDTDLIYSPFDDDNEWMLAKMSLNAASNVEIPAYHFQHNHIMMEPIRVEMLRTLSKNHPIYRLLQHHFKEMFAISVIGINVLTSAGSVFDQFTAWGADGTLRYTDYIIKTEKFTDTFEKRIYSRGLNYIPNYKRRDDALDTLRIMRKFIRKYLKIFYKNDKDLKNDYELKNWLSQTCKIVNGFPCDIDNLNDLINILSNIIFRVTIGHHINNGAVSWHVVSFPYNLMSLFHPLPTQKNNQINLNDYLPEESLIQLGTLLSAFFDKPNDLSESILQSYQSVNFGDDHKSKLISKIIRQYQNQLKNLERKINKREKNNHKRPFDLFKPSKIPHYLWV